MRINPVWIACCLTTAAAVADDGAAWPKQGVLLLKNDELISGTINPRGDRYEVTFGEAETYIRRGDVQAICNDAHECYQHKRSSIDQGQVRDHVALAEWCLRQSLIEDAEFELAEARRTDPTYPKIQLVERRLELAKETQMPVNATATSERANGNEQLDRLVRSLPTGAMESFTNTVQPLLLNHCSKAGCHGPQSSSALKLERIGLNQSTGRRPTQRNLQAALAMIDRANPADSKLLHAPLAPHGTSATPIFSEHDQSQYRQLVLWVYSVSGMRTAFSQPTLEERGAPLLQNLPRGAGANAPELSKKGMNDRNGVVPADWAESFPNQADAMRASSIEPASKAGAAKTTSAPESTAHQKRDAPRDPFDPEIFNRQFHER